MNKRDQFAAVIAAYRRHGWELRRALVTTESLAEGGSDLQALLAGRSASEAPFDALWFARPAAKDREAWELRLVAETPYALFEAFESEEAEEQREDVRREMEARMREYTAKAMNDA